MPYSLKKTEDNSPKYTIRFRGAAMIPKLNQMAPCRVELSLSAISQILESLYRRPMRLEVKYIDKNKREWEINYSNYMKILPVNQNAEKKNNSDTDVVVTPVVEPVNNIIEPTYTSNVTDQTVSSDVNDDIESTLNDIDDTDSVEDEFDEDTSEDLPTTDDSMDNQTNSNQSYQQHRNVKHGKHRRK